MRHLDLGLGIRGLRPLEEDLQNEHRTVDDPHIRLAFMVQCLLDITDLPRRQFVIKDDYVDRLLAVGR